MLDRMKYIFILLIILILQGCSTSRSFEPATIGEEQTEVLTLGVHF